MMCRRITVNNNVLLFCRWDWLLIRWGLGPNNTSLLPQWHDLGDLYSHSQDTSQGQEQLLNNSISNFPSIHCALHQRRRHTVRPLHIKLQVGKFQRRKLACQALEHACQLSKFSKPGFNSTWTMNFQTFKLDLEKAGEQKLKLPTSAGLPKKHESSRKTSTFALLATPRPLTVWTTRNWKILKEKGIPDHLICLLRNLYARQETTVRYVPTGHGITDWFQISKGVCQGCMLSPCLFYLYAEYIMWNTRLDEAPAGIKIAGRNINNLR